MLLLAVPAAGAEGGAEGVNLTLPDELPFDIVLPSGGGFGIVHSEDFAVTNNGENVSLVSLVSARVEIADTERFAVSDSEALPDAGNTIHISLVCAQNGAETRYALSETPSDAHEYALAGGETATFRFDGVVNELGDAPWSETTVTVSLCFAVNGGAASPEAEEVMEPPEVDEAAEETPEPEEVAETPEPDEIAPEEPSAPEETPESEETPAPEDEEVTEETPEPEPEAS
jgi:hypothetical protein